MVKPFPQHDLPYGDGERLSGAAAAWDDGLVGTIIEADFFSSDVVALYVGSAGQAAVLLGTRTPAQLYLGARKLFP